MDALDLLTRSAAPLFTSSYWHQSQTHEKVDRFWLPSYTLWQASRVPGRSLFSIAEGRRLTLASSVWKYFPSGWNKMSPSRVDHGVASHAKWHYPLSCQIPSSVETLHTLARHSRRLGHLTWSVNACHFFPEPDTSHLYNNPLLGALFYSLFL